MKTSEFLCALALSIPALNLTAGAPAVSDPVLGYWESTQQEGVLVGIEAKRFLLANTAGEIMVLPVELLTDGNAVTTRIPESIPAKDRAAKSIVSGSIRVPDLGQAYPGGMRFRWALEDGILTLRHAFQLRHGDLVQMSSLSFRRQEKRPLAFDIKPLRLPPPARLSAPTVSAIRDSLVERMNRDQKARRQGTATLEGQMDDYQWLKSTVMQHGWIDQNRFGDRASLAAFLIVQHGLDMSLRLAAQKALQEEFRQKAPVQGMYSWLADRSNLYLTGKQTFGTHYRTTRQGTIEILPLEDPGGVELSRKQLALEPFSTHRMQLGRVNGGKVVLLNGL